VTQPRIFRWRLALVTAVLVPILSGSVPATGQAEPTSLPDFNLPPRDWFSASTDRPLLSPNRRRSESVTGEPAAAIAAVPGTGVDNSGSFRLLGLVSGGKGRAVALVRDDHAGRQFRLAPGDGVNGWIVQQIDRRSITLTAGPVTQQVRIGDALPQRP
jgi:hypothetical protein